MDFWNNGYLYPSGKKLKTMRQLVLFLTMCIPLALFSQVNQTDANGMRQGSWQKTWPNGRMMYKGQFKDDKPVGEWTRYYEGGQIKARIRYCENSDSAYTRLFNNDGEKLAEGVYVDKKREGNWIFYSNGQKIAEETYADGLKHGVSKTYYPTGELFEMSDWQNGKQDGNHRVFFKNGKPYMQCKYADGKRNGLCLSYFKNGRIEMEAHYNNNLRDGEWKFYSEQGDSLYSLKYDQGKLLNPEVRDSIDNLEMQNMERGRRNTPDPEKFIQNPTEYMRQMQKFR